MRILVFGDIHGNLIALEKLLTVLEPEVDRLICHGDVVNYGPWSNECVELLDTINCECLLGNHEEAYLEGRYEGKHLVNQFFNATYPEFKKLDIIKKYKKSYVVEDFYMKHTINNLYYYPDTDISSLQIDKHTVIGHSHYPFIKKNKDAFYFINTGSVGQNRKNLSIINCAILDVYTKKVEIISIPYDPQPLISEMLLRNYPKECVAYYKNKL